MVHKYVEEELKEKPKPKEEKFDCVTKLTDSMNVMVQKKLKEREEAARK